MRVIFKYRKIMSPDLNILEWSLIALIIEWSIEDLHLEPLSLLPILNY